MCGVWGRVRGDVRGGAGCAVWFDAYLVVVEYAEEFGNQAWDVEGR